MEKEDDQDHHSKAKYFHCIFLPFLFLCLRVREEEMCSWYTLGSHLIWKTLGTNIIRNYQKIKTLMGKTRGRRGDRGEKKFRDICEKIDHFHDILSLCRIKTAIPAQEASRRLQQRKALAYIF